MIGCGLAGCMATGTKVDESLLPRFVKGQTLCADVVAQIGKPPNRSTIRDDGTRQLLYSYTQAQIKAENLIPIVGPLLGGATAEETHTTFECDQRDVLVSYSSTQGQTEVGRGLMSGARQK